VRLTKCSYFHGRLLELVRQTIAFYVRFYYRTQVRLCFIAVCEFFIHSFFCVCESNISGTAERICTKFTGKTCLMIPVEVKGQDNQGQKSDVHALTPGSDGMERAR